MKFKVTWPTQGIAWYVTADSADKALRIVAQLLGFKPFPQGMKLERAS